MTAELKKKIVQIENEVEFAEDMVIQLLKMRNDILRAPKHLKKITIH